MQRGGDVRARGSEARRMGAAGSSAAWLRPLPPRHVSGSQPSPTLGVEAALGQACRVGRPGGSGAQCIAPARVPGNRRACGAVKQKWCRPWAAAAAVRGVAPQPAAGPALPISRRPRTAPPAASAATAPPSVAKSAHVIG